MYNKHIRKIVNYIPIALLAFTLIMYFSVSSKAYNNIDDTWSVYSLYEDDEDVSDTFGEKHTDSSVMLNIISCSGAMDFRVVGALEKYPGAYADCSQGRTYRATEYNAPIIFNMYNTVYEWNYTYAGILATSTKDELRDRKSVV